MKVYNFKVTSEAEADAAEIFKWYENKVHGLGDRFLLHLEKSFNKIVFNPLAFANTDFLDFRRFVLTIFPYKIFYLLKDDTIVIAVNYS